MKIEAVNNIFRREEKVKTNVDEPDSVSQPAVAKGH